MNRYTVPALITNSVFKNASDLEECLCGLETGPSSAGTYSKKDNPDGDVEAQGSLDPGMKTGALRLMSQKGLEWVPGQTLKVGYLPSSDLSAEQIERFRQKVEEHSKEWTKHGNLVLDFNSNGPFDIRVLFVKGSYCASYVGTRATKVDQSKPTITLGLEVPSETDVRRRILHEFGHALGFVHEHCSPDRPFRFTKQFIDDHNTETDPAWTPGAVHDNLLVQYPKEEIVTHSPFDKDSIMAYRIRSNETENGYQIGYNSQLSEGDMLGMRNIYGPPEGSKPEVLRDDRPRRTRKRRRHPLSREPITIAKRRLPQQSSVQEPHEVRPWLVGRRPWGKI